MNQVKHLFTRYKMLALVIAVAFIWLFFSWQTEGGFLTPRNLSNLLRQMSISGILACGMVLVIISGEIDLSVGTEHAFRNGVVLFADLKTSQYPAMEGWSGVDFVNAKLQRRFGPVLLGGRMKYLMSGGYANDVQLIPFGEVSAPVVADVTAGLHAQACYNFNEGAAADAWTACTITARLSWRALSLYVKRAVQMDDAIYTDRQHAVERVIVGAGWRRSW